MTFDTHSTGLLLLFSDFFFVLLSLYCILKKTRKYITSLKDAKYTTFLMIESLINIIQLYDKDDREFDNLILSYSFQLTRVNI